MPGDPVDAGAVADQDRRLADSFLRTTDVPGASRHGLAGPRRAGTFGEHGVGGGAGPQGRRRIRASQPRGEKATGEGVARAGRIVDLDRIDRNDVDPVTVLKRDLAAPAGLDDDRSAAGTGSFESVLGESRLAPVEDDDVGASRERLDQFAGN